MRRDDGEVSKGRRERDETRRNEAKASARTDLVAERRRFRVHLVVVEPHDTTVFVRERRKEREEGRKRVVGQNVVFGFERRDCKRSCCLQDGDTEERGKHGTDETDQVVEEGNDLCGEEKESVPRVRLFLTLDERDGREEGKEERKKASSPQR